MTTPSMRIGKGITVSAIVGLLVAMNELNRLSGQVLDTTGRAWPFTALMAPGRSEGWGAIFPAYGTERAAWLVAYVVLDLVLIGLYGVVIPRWLVSKGALPLARSLRILAVVDILEDVCALIATFLTGSAAVGMGTVANVFSTLKWVLLLVTAFLLVRHLLLRRSGRGEVAAWVVGFYKQRFSILAVVPLALLTIPAGSDLLDQLPDVQRRWIEDAQGVRHFLSAAAAVAIVTIGVLVVGRLRSGAMWQRQAGHVADEPLANLPLGLLVVGVLAVALLVVSLRGGGAPWSMPGLQPLRLAGFLGVPVLMVTLSFVIRRRLQAEGYPTGTGWFSRHFQPKLHEVLSAGAVEKVVLAGDILTGISIVVGGLGLVRSFTAVVALAAVGLGHTWWALLPLVLGVALTLLGWPLARAAARAVTNDALAGGDQSRWTLWQRIQATLTPTVRVRRNLGLRLAVLLFGILLFFFVGAFPEQLGHGIGVIATSALALLAATLVVGGSVVVVQDQKAPEVFWFKGARLRSVPVTTLLLLTIAVTTGIGSDVDIHGIRGLESGAGAPVAAAARLSMTGAIDAWAAATSGCGHTVTAGGQTYRLRPMFLLGAEGGGIRAAYWTTAGLDLFRSAATPQGDGVDWSQPHPENRCARALFGGGASGGAVGLTVARFAGTGLARDAARAMATPDALGAATSGLFVRDTAYSATGIPFFGAPTYARPPGSSGPTWLDRAGLIETSWQRTSGLQVPFLPDDPASATSAVTGSLILNSTRVADGCRMWVSQVRLANGDQESCDFAATPAGHTLDLFAALGSGANGAPAVDDHCLGPITAATGAMLASRFPFVTPSGVAGPCAGQREQQLVDGGYVENTGLATILDLAPSWLADVQSRNAAAVRAGGPIIDIVVPVVMYFDNGTGGDLVVDPPGPTSEILVPTTTNARAKTALLDTPALLRNCARILAATGLFDPSTGAPAGLAEQIDGWRRHPVVVVHQSTFPSVTAPLGWVLSEESMATMDRALAAQATLADRTTAVASVTANGSLKDAIDLVRPDAP